MNRAPNERYVETIGHDRVKPAGSMLPRRKRRPFLSFIPERQRHLFARGTRSHPHVMVLNVRLFLSWYAVTVCESDQRWRDVER